MRITFMLGYKDVIFLYIRKKCWKYDRGLKNFTVLADDFFSIFELLETFLKNNNQILRGYKSNSSAALSRLDNLYHYFNSIKSDKLNRNIYFLTIISGIFLPLNLIVGFFGMNTEGLFFKENPQGTLVVAYLLIGILFFSLVGFNIFHLIDRYLLRIFLGKSTIYKQLAKKLNKLEESFKTK